jgi:hypothetical protein
MPELGAEANGNYEQGGFFKMRYQAAFPTHYRSLKSGLLKKVSAHTASKVIGYALLWPICDLGETEVRRATLAFIAGAGVGPPNRLRLGGLSRAWSRG